MTKFKTKYDYGQLLVGLAIAVFLLYYSKKPVTIILASILIIYSTYACFKKRIIFEDDILIARKLFTKRKILYKDIESVKYFPQLYGLSSVQINLRNSNYRGYIGGGKDWDKVKQILSKRDVKIIG